tara:strand:- start:6465 stop:6701 length:237 start_codon:yes stop_codon:yes gene_type:complete
MPLYEMKNLQTGETSDMIVTIAKMEEMVSSGEWKHVMGAPALITHTGNMINKTSGDWKDHLKNIKKSASRRRPNSVNI